MRRKILSLTLATLIAISPANFVLADLSEAIATDVINVMEEYETEESSTSPNTSSNEESSELVSEISAADEITTEVGDTENKISVDVTNEEIIEEELSTEISGDDSNETEVNDDEIDDVVADATPIVDGSEIDESFNVDNSQLTLQGEELDNSDIMLFSATTGFSYSIIDATYCTITGYTGTETELEIPTEIDGHIVQEISWQAFYNCKNLVRVTIPSSVTVIGHSAFRDCSALEEIILSEGITTIDWYAFYGCKKLTNVVVPDSVTHIESYAFSNCTSLIQVILPQDLTDIKSSLFYNCENLLNIEIPENVASIGDNAFYNCNSLSRISLPNSVRSIGEKSFYYCSNLTAVNLSSNLEYIGEMAFYRCRKLLSVEIPSCLKNIETATFYDCDSLNEIIMHDGTVSIGASSFYGCDMLKQVIIPNSIISIGENAFKDCIELADITLSKSIINIGISAFTNTKYYNNKYNWENDALYIYDYLIKVDETMMGTYVIKENTKVIAGNAFYNCTDLNYVQMQDSIISIGDSAFENCSNLSNIDVSKKIEHIGSSAFKGCVNLKNISFENTVNYIGDSAFYGCEKLTKFTIPQSVTVIGKAAFYDCFNLNIVEWNALNVNDFSYASKVFENAGKNVTEGLTIIFSDQTKNIPKYACSGCLTLKTVIIGKNITSLGAYAFDDCYYLSSVYWNAVDADDCSSSLRLFENAGQKNLELGFDVYFGESVINIPNYLFYSCDTLNNVDMGQNIQNIGNSSFNGCTNLKNIVIPKYVTTIGSYAFNNCTKMENIYWNAKMATGFSDGNCGTEASNGLTVEFGDDVLSIPNSAFSRYSALKKIIISNNVESIGAYAFNGCINLEEVIIPDSVTVIGTHAFLDCTGLKQITIGKNVSTIEKSAFWDCVNIEKIFWNAENVSDFSSGRILNSAGQNGNGIELIFGESVKHIPANLFNRGFSNYKESDTPKIASVKIGSNISSIGASAFYDCISIEIVNVENLESWCNISFDNSFSNPAQYGVLSIDGSTITSIEIPQNVTTVNAYAFYNCTEIKSIILHENITNIGANAFYNCIGLETIEWNAKNAITKEDVFGNSGKDGMGIDVMFGNGVESIPSKLFSANDENAPRVTNVIISNSVKTIGTDAFFNCIYLEKIYWDAVSIEDFTSKNTMFTYAGEKGDGIDVVFGENVKSIPAYIFYPQTKSASYGPGTPKIINVSIGKNVVDIGDYAFFNCCYIEKIEWNAKECFGFDSENNIFSNVGSSADGTNVIFGDDVIIIPEHLFYSAKSTYKTPNIKNVVIGNSVETIGKYAFYKCTNLVSSIPDNVSVIGEYAFYSCVGLNGKISNNVKSVGEYAFYNCRGLTNVDLSSVKIINERTFYGCEGILNVVIGSNVESINSYAFSKCTSLTSIIIPDSVMYVGSYAFCGCSSATILSIGAHVNNVDDYAFEGCKKIVEIELKAQHLADFAYSNHIFSNVGTETDGIVVVFGDNVEVIPAYVFYSGESSYVSPNIVNVIISNAVKSIGNYAFNNCSSIERIEFGEGLTHIGSYALGNCIKLESIDIPSSVSTIANGAFYGCKGLTNVTIEDGVTSIGNRAFSGCTSLTEIIIPESVMSIGEEAFYNCEKLTNLIIPEAVNNIGKRAFSNCTGLTNVNINSNTAVIGIYAFEDCSKLSSVDFGEGIIAISDSAFHNCTSLSKINSNNNIRVIYSRAFRGCSSLTYVTFSEVEYIGDYAFDGCNALCRVELSPSTRWIGDHAFSYCASLETIYLPAKYYAHEGYATGTSWSYYGAMPEKKVQNPEKQIYANSIDIYGKNYASPGDTIYISKSVMPYNSTNRIVKWSSSDESVATVESGIVKCKSNGKVTITADLQVGPSDTITIVVTDSKLQIDGDEFTLIPDDTTTIYATLESDDYTGADAVWTTNDSSIAVVESSGYTDNGDGTYTLYAEIKGINMGETYVTVSVGEISDSASVVVNNTSMKFITPNEEGKDFIACKIAKDSQSVIITAEFRSFTLTEQDVEWSIENVKGRARIGEIQFVKDITVTDGTAGDIRVEVIGESKGEVKLIGKSSDGVEIECKVMVQEPLKIVSSTPNNGETNVSLWGGKLLGCTSENGHFSNDDFTITFDGKMQAMNGLAELKRYDTDGTVITYEITEGDVSDDGNLLYLNFSFNYDEKVGFETDTKYYVTIDESALKSTDDEYFFEGIADKDDLKFTTEKEGISYYSDNLPFLNNSDDFFAVEEEHKYYIDDYKLRQDLYERCTEPQFYKLLKNYNDTWGGSCFGMSAIVSLVHNNLLSQDSILEGAKRVYDFPLPTDLIDGRHTMRDNINYYQLTQHIYDYDIVYGYKMNYFESGWDGLIHPFSKALEQIVNRAKLIESNGAFILSFSSSIGGHAVVAHRYREREDYYEIEICDPNKYSPVLLQINKDYSDCHFSGSASTYNEKLSRIAYCEPKDILNGTISLEPISYVYVDTNSAFTLGNGMNKIAYDGNTFSGDSNLLQSFNIIGEGEKTYYVLGIDSNDISIEVTSDEFDCSIVTPDMFVASKGTNITNIEFSNDDKTVNVSGNNMQHTTYISSESDNHDMISVSGNGCNNIELDASKGDVEIHSDNLNNVNLSLFDKYNKTEETISSTTNKIVVGADGSVESDAVVFGDVFNDGIINMRDAQRLYMYIVGSVRDLTEYELMAADVYRDGKINVKDAQKLAQYLAGWPDVKLGE